MIALQGLGLNRGCSLVLLFFFLVLTRSAVAGIFVCKDLLKHLVAGEVSHEVQKLFPDPNERIIWPRSIVPQSKLTRTYYQKVEHFFDSGKSGLLRALDGINLSYRVFESPKERGAVVIAVGIQESITQWQEQIYSLAQEGYSVYLMDHRGQGHSPRVTKNPQVSHIDSFDQYVGDLRQFVQEVVKKKPHPMRFILGNSMGGLISTLYSNKYPKDFDAVIATVPAFDIYTKGIPKWIARIVLQTQWLFGRSKEYVMGHKDLHLLDLRKLSFPGYEARINHAMETYFRYPTTLMGGPSNGWLWAVLDAVKKVSFVAEKSRVPSLMIEAGKDEIVKPSAISDFAARSPVATHYSEPDMNHFVFYSKDESRSPMLAEMYRYMINPIRLDVPARGNEVRRLMVDVERYLKRGEVALARYTQEEAYRVLAWKSGQRAEWRSASFMMEMEALNTRVSKAYEELEPGQKALYHYLSWRRSEEMKKLYPAPPKP